MPTLRIHDRPFVALAILLMVAVFVADFCLEVKMLSIFTFSLFLLAILCLFFIGKKWSAFLLAALVFNLGVFLLLLKRSDQNLQHPELAGASIFEVVEVKESQSGWNQLLCQLHFVRDGDELGSSRERIVLISQENLLPGDRCIANLDLNQIETKGNPGEFDLKHYWNSKNIRYQGFLSANQYKLLDHGSSWLNVFYHIREDCKELIHSYLPEKTVGLATAILLGDKSLLDKVDLLHFQDAGAMHVLAVSGLHVGIVMLLLNFLFQRASKRISRRQAILFTLILTFIYAGVTGFSPSVLRSFIMFGLLMIAQTKSWSMNSLNALGIAAVLLILINPLVVYDMGFQLSFAAMLGILVLYRDVESLFQPRNKILLRVWQGTAVGMAAQLTTLPLTLYHFHQFANYFWLSNILVMAFAGIILASGLLFLILGRIPILAKLIGFVLGIITAFFLHSMQFIAELPFAIAAGFSISPWFLVIFSLFILYVLVFRFRRKHFYPLLSSALVILFILQFQRGLNMMKNEVILFNHFAPLIAYKQGLEVCIFFPDSTDPESIRAVSNDYAKLIRAKLSYMPIKVGKDYASDHGDFKLSLPTNGIIHIQLNDETYSFIYQRGRDKMAHGKLIYSSFLSQVSSDHLSLAKGALRLELN